MPYPLEQWARKFDEGDVAARFQVASDLREGINDICHGSDYKNFLTLFMPLFMKNLSEGQPQFTETAEQKVRVTMLEIFNRLPSNDALRGYVAPLLRLMMELLEKENEENAVVALRVIIDLHKTFRPALEGEVQPFLDFVYRIYSELPKTVLATFRDTGVHGAAPQPRDMSAVGALPHEPAPKVAGQQLVSSMRSFKVLTECPIIVVLLFQLYPRFLAPNINRFMPVIVQALCLQAPPIARDPAFHGPYVDFIAAQVKTLSFLAYMLRSFADHLRPYADKIPGAVIHLLNSCPQESASTRKELLIATRHILATDFRHGFVPQIDVLLSEKVLIGTGRTSFDTLRPLAYSTLADLVHHVRSDLSLLQLSQVVHLYSRNIHDQTLPFNIQSMSAKLLLNLVECIARKSNPEEGSKGRVVLMRILDAFVNKFSSLKKQIPKLLATVAPAAAAPAPSATAPTAAAGGSTTSGGAAPAVAPPPVPLSTSLSMGSVPGTHQVPPVATGQPATGSSAQSAAKTAKNNDSIKDCRQLMKTLVLGLKNIVWGIQSCTPRPPPMAIAGGPPVAPAKVLSIEESEIFSKLLKNCLRCFAIYTQGPSPSPQEEKDILDHVSAVFAMIDMRIFQDVFYTHIPFLFQSICENQTVLTIPQHLLANPSVSKAFAETCLNFLMQRMGVLGGSKTEATITLRLFKLVFSSVSLFAENEVVLQPHIGTIVSQVLKHTSESTESLNYFILLRSLFRSIGGGKVDMFLNQLAPLVPGLLESLNRLQNTPHAIQMRELFVELALTIPLRMNTMLPHIKLQLPSVLLALEATTPDLVSQGLKVAEMWVDQLSPAFFDSALQESRNELVQAIFKQLRGPNSALALRILGKMGGRGRQFLQQPQKTKNQSLTRDGFVVGVKFPDAPASVAGLPLERAVMYCRARLLAPYDLESKKQVFGFVRACLDCAVSAQVSIWARPVSRPSANRMDTTPSGKEVAVRRTAAEDLVLRTLIECVIIAYAQEKLRAELPQLATYYEDLIVFFAIETSGDIFVDAVAECLMSETNTLFAAGFHAIEVTHRTYQQLDVSHPMPVLDEMCKRLCDGCHRFEWSAKSGSCHGLLKLTGFMPQKWVQDRLMLIFDALMLVIKDSAPGEAAGVIHDEAHQIVNQLVSRCFQSESAATDEPPPTLSASDQLLKPLVTSLVSHLSSHIGAARRIVKELFVKLSALTKIKTRDLIEASNARAIVVEPLLQENLNNLSITHQTGVLELLTYLMNLDTERTAEEAASPPLVPVSAELYRMLESALSIAVKDELYTGRSVQQRHLQAFTPWRIASIELLSAAISLKEIHAPENTDVRNRIISVFFKALTVPPKEVVQVARNGLSQVIKNVKIPKEVIQQSLRPVLLNLADHRKLSVPLLEGLALLVEMLTNCFNVTLGEKLLEHLNKWVDPKQAVPSASKSSLHSQDVKICTAIVDIFHLLPPQASKFLDPLVNVTLALESQLPRETISPFRVPLLKFLNKYKEEAVEHFFARLHIPQFCKAFRLLVHEESAQPLRGELARDVDRFIRMTFNNTTGVGLIPPGSREIVPEPPLLGVLLLRSIVKYMPEWLKDQPSVARCLMDLWQSEARLDRLNTMDMTMTVGGSVSLSTRESKIIIKCLLNYSHYHKDQVDLLFDLMSIFQVRATTDFSFLHDFFTEKLPKNYTVDEKRKILHRFLQRFKEPSYASEQVHVIRIMIIPMILHAANSGEIKQLMDAEIVKSIITDVFDASKPPPSDESLNIEILLLASNMLRYIPSEIEVHRKEFIKFAWLHMKSQDVTTRQCAHMLVARFTEAYDSPEKVILQVYVALLRAHQPEAKSLVKQALDILSECLEKRMPHNGKHPHWIKWTRRLLVEEGHSNPQLVHILHTIVRHANLFYPSRGNFAIFMISSLSRIGLAPNSPHENRKLALEVVACIIHWEKQHQLEVALKAQQPPPLVDVTPTAMETTTESTQDGAKPAGDETLATSMEVDDVFATRKSPEQPQPAVASGGSRPSMALGAPVGPPAVPSVELWRPTPQLIEMTANFLIRSASTPSDNSTESTLLISRSLELLHEALVTWPDVYLKFAYFEKLLQQGDQQPQVALSALTIINVIMQHQPRQFVIQNVQPLQASLLPCFFAKNPKIAEAACQLLGMILAKFPLYNAATGQVEQHEMSNFYVTLADQLEMAFGNADRYPLPTLLTVLRTLLSPDHPEFVDRFIPNLSIKVIGKLVRDYSQPQRDPVEEARAAAAAANPNNPQAVANATAAAAQAAAQQPRRSKEIVASLAQVFQICSLRFSDMAVEYRRQLLMSINYLLDRANDVELLTEITRVVAPWIIGPKTKDVNADSVAGSAPEAMVVDSSAAPSIPASKKDMSSVLTLKEKVEILRKMLRFDATNQPNQPLFALQSMFLDIVHHLYAGIRRGQAPGEPLPAEIGALEPAIFMALRSKDPSIRNKMFETHLQAIVPTTAAARLQAVLTSSTMWEAMGSYFWIKQALDMLLGALVPNQQLAYMSSYPPHTTLPPFAPQRPPPPTATGGKAAIPGSPLWQRHAAFVSAAQSAKFSTILPPLRELVYQDSELAYHLWVAVYGLAWSSLPRSDREKLAPQFIELLEKDFHGRSQRQFPHCVQALLDGVASCAVSGPRIPAFVLKHLGRTCNAWHIALKLLEDHVTQPKAAEEDSLFLADLYQMVNEEDLYTAVWQSRAMREDTKVGIGLLQHGYWPFAQDVFFGAMDRSQRSPPGTLQLSMSEKQQWEMQWLECAKRLQQWDVLSDYSRQQQHADLAVDCAWRASDWNFFRDSLMKSSFALPDSLQGRIYQAYLSMHDVTQAKQADMENIVTTAFALAGRHASALPDIPSLAHVPVLQQCQQLVELRESSLIIKELAASRGSTSQQAQVSSDIKQTLVSWRNRQPNIWDDVLHWNSLLQWRRHIFDTIASCISPTDPNQLPVLAAQETTKLALTFGRVARKQRLPELAMNSLNKLVQATSMTQADSFTKARDKAKCCLMIGGTYSKTALDALNSVNVDAFNGLQKSEIATLRGEIAARLNSNDEAYKWFSASVDTVDVDHPNPSAWFAWARFCDALASSAHAQESVSATWAQYAANCYCQGLLHMRILPDAKDQRQGSGTPAARLLSIVAEYPTDRIRETFDKYAEAVPTHLWLPWLTHLFGMLHVPNAATTVRNIIIRLIHFHPQAVFYRLRAFRMALEAVPAAADSAAAMDVSLPTSASYEEKEAKLRQTPVTSAKQAVNDLYDLLKSALQQSNVTTDLELFARELASAFQPTAEEYLLNTLKGIASMCYQSTFALATAVPPVLQHQVKLAIAGLQRLYDADAETPTLKARSAAFRQAHGVAFEAEFALVSDMPKLLELLHKWIELLTASLGSAPRTIPLYHLSPALSQLQNAAIELPGQYTVADFDPSGVKHLMLERLEHEVLLVGEQRYRCVFFRATNGRVYPFQVQVTPVAPQLPAGDVSTPLAAVSHLQGVDRADEPLLGMMNLAVRLLNKYKETRRRLVHLHVPSTTPLTPHTRLLGMEGTFTSLSQVLQENSANTQDQAYPALQYHRTNLVNNGSNAATKQAIYQEIIKTISDTSLTKSVTRSVSSLSELFTVKKQMSTQAGAQSMIQYMLGAPPPNAFGWQYMKNTGTIYFSQMYPAYNAEGLLMDSAVPFRLTRNITRLFGPLQINGPMNAAMVATATALQLHKDDLRHQLALLMHDDLLSLRYGLAQTSGDAAEDAQTRAKIRRSVQANINKLMAIWRTVVVLPSENKMTQQQINRRVTELIEMSQDPNQLHQMPPAFQEWL